MADSRSIAKKIASLCPGRWLTGYTKTKLRTDPLYNGVHQELQDQSGPLLDVGCGMGIFGLYLRERGWNAPITGFDYDQSKVTAGLKMIEKGGYQNISLSRGDARSELPDHSGNVTILDILQFFVDAEQRQLIKEVSRRVSDEGILVIRSGVKEKNLRFLITWIGDIFAKCTFWMKSAPIHYPTKEFFVETLEAEGFKVEVRPFWGRTPFNNYLIVAKRT